MPRRSAPLIVPLALAVASLGAQRAARSDESTDDPERSNERYALRAELGPELDTNVHRTERVDVAGVMNQAAVASPLARGVLTGSLSDVVGDGHRVAMSATLAAKLFEKSEARDEDVGIAESSLLWRAPLSARSALVLSGAYYEAFQRMAPAPVYSAERHDFRSLTPALRLTHTLGEHAEAGLGAGYRWFLFKPDRSYDFQAPCASLDVTWARETEDGGADWEAVLHATAERRAFDGAVLVAGMAGSPPLTGSAPRVDEFLTAALDVSRTGTVLVGGGYAVQVNASNSFGASATRHFATARFSAALPLDLYLAARTELLLAARYADSSAGRAYLSIEDENRSNVRGELSRNLSPRVQLFARYTFYFNPIGGSATSYIRQTALLSLAFTLEK
jgi:hypothetical protein